MSSLVAIPLSAIPSQTITVQLAGQATRLRVYGKASGLFIDVSVGGALLIGGVLCLHRRLIVRDAYLGFAGDLAFFDTQGIADPTWDGLGGRFFLGYLS